MAWSDERERQLRQVLSNDLSFGRALARYGDRGLAAAHAIATRHTISVSELATLIELPRIAPHDDYLVAIAAILSGRELVTPSDLDPRLEADLAARRFFARCHTRFRGSCDVPFLFRQAIPIVEARVGAASGYFIADTGAPHTAISRKWWWESGFGAPEIGAVQPIGDGAGNHIEAACVRIADFALGDAKAINVPAVIFDFPEHLEVAGILSPLDAFPGCRAQFDWTSRRLRIHSDIGGNREPVIWSGGNPLARVKLNEKETFLMIDTGAGHCALCEDGPIREGGKTTRSALGQLNYGESETRVLQWPGFREEVSFVSKICVDDLARAIPPLSDGLLGANLFEGRCLTISQTGWHL